MAGKRNRKSSRSPTAANVAHRKNRKCWRTNWRTLRIYLSAIVAPASCRLSRGRPALGARAGRPHDSRRDGGATRTTWRQLTARIPQLRMDSTTIFMAQPVFFDPRKARWKRIRLAFDVIGVSITLLVIFFAYTALRDEPLPDLLLTPQKRPYRALKEKEKEKAKERRKLAYLRRSHRKSRGAPSQVKLNQEEGIRAAFYVPYDAASFSSLREYARQIDLLFPDWLHTITPDGRLQSIDEQTNKFFDVMQDSTRPLRR